MKKFVKVLTLLVCLTMVLVCASCAGEQPQAATPSQSPTAPAETPVPDPVNVVISVEGFGDMEFELYPAYAPKTVANFVKLANDGYYEGVIFHRIVEDFMIQGGMGEEEVPTIKGEFASNGVNNPLHHERGVISMARVGGQPDSASSQFFICSEDSLFLDGEYAAFGKLTAGEDVLDAIAAVEVEPNPMTGELSSPVTAPVIASVTVK